MVFTKIKDGSRVLATAQKFKDMCKHTTGKPSKIGFQGEFQFFFAHILYITNLRKF